MQGNPELATELVQRLKFEVSGTKLTLTVKLPEKLLKELGDFASKEAEKKVKRSRKRSGKAKGTVQDK